MEKQRIISLPSDIPATTSSAVCENEIQGATPYNHRILAGDTLCLAPCGAYHVLILISGYATFETNGIAYPWAERVTFVPAPDQNVTVKADTDTQLLEIRWKMHEGDDALIRAYQTSFPYQMPYAACKQYREAIKSEKTINRVMIEQRCIPRFAMGSVETYGPDFVKSHAHPSLDQFFIGFPENDMFLLLDYEPYRMQGLEICHIPLGGIHGVDVTENKHLHYIWVDFLIDDTSMDCLDSDHKLLDTVRACLR